MKDLVGVGILIFNRPFNVLLTVFVAQKQFSERNRASFIRRSVGIISIVVFPERVWLTKYIRIGTW